MAKKSERSRLEEKIGYRFGDPEILEQSLVHASYANGKRKHELPNNERLEFLGDAVLQLVVSEYLFTVYEELSEGVLTRLRAAVVCEPVLAKLAQEELDLGSHLQLGKGEESSGGRKRPSILSDALEALIGAIYLDGGMEPAAKAVLRLLSSEIEAAHEGKLQKDYKTTLQEAVQKNLGQAVTYRLISQEGPDHDKTFQVQAISKDEVLGLGRGKSKKDAEQAAAQQALEKMNIDDSPGSR